MIPALIGDTVRVLLRGPALPLLVIVGAVLGLFVRATGTVEHAHLETAPLSGGAIEILLSTLFGAALVYAVVDGVRLAHDDRSHGLVLLCAARPVSRFAFAIGRVFGACLAQATGLAVLAVAAVATSGLPFAELPGLRRVIEATALTVDGRTIEARTEALVPPGSAARFAFAGGTRPAGQLHVSPRVVPGTKFSGEVRVRVDLERDGTVIESRAYGPLRPHQPLPLQFRDLGASPYTLAVHPGADDCLLAVVPEGLFLLGGETGVWPDAITCVALTALAACVLTSLAYALALGLALGPAALAAGFVWLLAQARSAVLDLVAGIGGGEGDPGAAVLLARRALATLVRAVPDLSAFHHAGRLGREQTLADGTVLAAAMAATPFVLAALLLAVAAAPFEER